MNPRPISHADDFARVATADRSAAAVLSAYLRAEQMHVFRRLLWRRLALLALVWAAFAAASPFVSRIGLVAGLCTLAVAAGGGLLQEWRAARTLHTLLSGRVVDHRA